ncbi:MAG: hypothetical protein P4L64_15780, partial [Caulobacteraceae bacterium]|nr:hypothetical protein [Caulobacteraceae bacterium]
RGERAPRARAEAPEVEAAGQAVAEIREEGAPREERAPRRARTEERPARRPAVEAAPPRREREREEMEETGVRGFGDDIPAFLRIPIPKMAAVKG